MDKLAKYKSMRSKGKTPEPFGDESPPFEKSQGKQGKPHPNRLYFVVQKHRATSLHYDFRLEVGGAMPSWAIPKGPSLDPAVKRLAMKTEDHPLDYRNFEGVIPEGEYGAGQVIIWDEGRYWPELEEDGKRVKVEVKSDGERIMEEGLKKGEIKFLLEGKRLKGSFALIKTRGFGGRENSWLLVKHKDEFTKPGFDVKGFLTSVVSGKDLEQIAKSTPNG